MVFSADTIIFICDKKDSIYADKALVGTTRYRVFLEYLDVLQLSVNDVLLYHEDDYKTVEAIAGQDPKVRVITLGSAAEKAIKGLQLNYMSLPLTISDVKTNELDSELAKVGNYIHDRQN